MIAGLEPIEIAAPLVAGAGLSAYLYLGKRHYGADADYWEVIRRSLLPQLNRFARREGLGYAAYKLTEEEFIGTYPQTPEEFEERLEELGFERQLLSAFKYAPDGREEVGSWAWRPSQLSRYQLHVIPFEREPERGSEPTTDAAAHFEYNARNPATALLHYIGAVYVKLGNVIEPGSLLERGPAEIYEMMEARVS